MIFSDVTEKKKLETQFLRAQRMESIGTLAGGIAHDLNNVLTPLLISVQLLKEKIADAEGQQMLDSLETNVKRGARPGQAGAGLWPRSQGRPHPVQPRHICA